MSPNTYYISCILHLFYHMYLPSMSAKTQPKPIDPKCNQKVKLGPGLEETKIPKAIDQKLDKNAKFDPGLEDVAAAMWLPLISEIP